MTSDVTGSVIASQQVTTTVSLADSGVGQFLHLQISQTRSIAASWSIPARVELLADTVRVAAVALNNLIVGREFLACQLSKERELLTDDEYREAVDRLKVRRTKSDLDLVRQAELLTMLAPDAVDSDVAAVALGCSIKDASRALAAALDGARRASADMLPSAGPSPE